MNGEPAQDHFADGIMEDLIPELAKVNGFARNTTSLSRAAQSTDHICIHSGSPALRTPSK
jgi:TolB-like protein